jgi:hypothetical protein
MRKIVLIPLLASACAQTPPPQPQSQRQQTWEEFIRERPDTFIQSYRASIDAEAARLRAAGLGRNLDFIRAQVDAQLPPGNYTLQATGATAAILRRLRVDENANLLVRAGYRIRHLAAPQQARSLVSAAADRFGDADALVLFAPIVLVADLDRTDKKPDGSADLVYRVTEAIKSAPPVGSEFRLFLSGPMPAINSKPGDPPPPPPIPNPAMQELGGYKRAVFFFQPPNKVEPRPNSIAGEPVTLFGPMPIGDGDRVLPGYHSGTQPTTLAAIRAAARAQLCSPGYVPVVRGSDLPHRC